MLWSTLKAVSMILNKLGVLHPDLLRVPRLGQHKHSLTRPGCQGLGGSSSSGSPAGPLAGTSCATGARVQLRLTFTPPQELPVTGWSQLSSR